jgi:hypothetical protein
MPIPNPEELDAMLVKTLIAGSLTAAFLAVPFAGMADAASKRKPVHTSGNMVQQGSAQQGSMDGWPQNLDELANAYNCGPYADAESAKKCKK